MSHLVIRVNWQHFAEVCKNNHTNPVMFHSGFCNMIHIIPYVFKFYIYGKYCITKVKIISELLEHCSSFENNNTL